MAEVSAYDPSMLIGSMKLDVIADTPFESMVTASVDSHSLTIACLYEGIGTLQYQ
jgi:hypothetical protein